MGVQTCMSGNQFWISTFPFLSSWMGDLIAALTSLCLIWVLSHFVSSELGERVELIELEPLVSHPP